MLLPAFAILKKACTIPSTVPRNPIIGAPPAMVASIGSPFSSLAISTLPIFSTEVWMSAKGLPMRSIPFSTRRATGESYFWQSDTADFTFPS